MSEFLKEQEAHKNSEFIRQAAIRRKMSLINEQSYKAIVRAYKMKDEETKAVYDENPELYFSGRATNMSNDIESIKKNVQFFFWITMISLNISFLGLIIDLAES